MRSAYKGQLAVPYRVGSLGHRPRPLARSLCEQHFAHGYCTPLSCRRTDIGHDWNVKRGEHHVAVINGIPILIAPGENDCKENNEFIRWVHRARRLSSMIALRASANAADVRLERKLRFECVKH